MSLTSPIFPSTQIILRIYLQVSNNLTTFSFMRELTLSRVGHTKVKLQVNLLIYSLSIVTEEKNEFSRHDVFHPEFCKPLFIPFSTVGCICVCIFAQLPASMPRLWFDMKDPSRVVISMLFWALTENQVYVGHRLSLWNSQKTLEELCAFESAPQWACYYSHKVPQARKRTAWVGWLLVPWYHLSAQQQDPV